MNAYFENTNTRYNNVRTRTLPSRTFGDGLISFICAIVGMLTCPAAVAIEKTAVVFALFISFAAVVGAIEAGSMSMLFGILICGFISVLEYLILKNLFKSPKSSKNAQSR